MPTFWLRGRSKSPPSGVWTSLLPVLPRLRYPFWSSLTFSVQALLQSCVVFETLTVQYQLYIYQYHVMLLDSVTHVLMTSDYKIRLNAPTYLLTYLLLGYCFVQVTSRWTGLTSGHSWQHTAGTNRQPVSGGLNFATVRAHVSSPLTWHFHTSRQTACRSWSQPLH